MQTGSTKRNRIGSGRGVSRAAGLTVAVLMLAGTAASGADITWTGSGTGQKWSTGANWSSTVDWPLNPSVHQLIFANNDLSDTVAKVLADIPDWEGATPTNVWRVGGLRITNTSGRHLLDLDSKTLRISTTGGTTLGDLYLRGATARMNVLNGTIIVERDILVDSGTLDLTGATLHGVMRDVKVGSLAGTGYADLSGTIIGGGVLDVRDLYIGARKSTQGYLYMNASTDIDTLWVRGTMIIADSQSSVGQIGWQDPSRANEYFLPPGLNLVFGDKAAGESGRGNLRITLNGTGGSSGAVGRLAVHDGGTFDGWLNLIDVGRSDAASGSSTARLDLRGLNSFALDAKTLRIGTTLSGNAGTPNGIAWLPAGTARVDTVIMGDVALNNRATLDLTGTVLEIDALLDMRDSTGANPTELIVRVLGISCGMDLAADAELSLQGPATINLRFEAAPEPGQDHYWGLRWAGNHAAVIGELVQSGTITMTLDFAEAADYRAAVYVAGGYTYAALIDDEASVPPAVAARARSAEVDAATTTRIDANDLLLALYNPDALAETGRTIAHPDVNGGTAAEYLDFPTDSLPITYSDVLLTVTFAGAVTATDTADVSFTPLAGATTANLTWTGQADDFEHLDRREWFWGANWSAGQPPANPTTATLTYGDDANTATLPSLLAPVSDWNGTTPTNRWQIGSLRIGNTAGQHTLDLGGQTLALTGNLQAARLFATGALNMTLTNGAVTVGGSFSVANGTITFANVQLAVTNDITADAASQIKFGGSTLQGKLRDLLIAGTAEGQAGSVDLRGATIGGGVLDTRDLFVGGRKNNQGYLYMDGTTAITELRARRNVIIGNGQSGIGQIGRLVPALGNDYYLPPNVNLVFGDRDLAPAGRGSVRIAIADVGGGGPIGRLAVESGGTFDGWLSLLDVGSADTSSGGTGRLDLRGLSAFTLDATELKIGTTSGSNSGVPNGIAWLPPGTARVDRVTMGHASLNNRATLDLTGTVLEVAESMGLLDNAGANPTELIVHVQGVSCGPDLASDATLTLTGPAKIELRFEAAPETGQDHYWGLRWAGNQAAVLGGLAQSGALQLSMHFAESNDYRTAVYFEDGFTYAGLLDADAAVPAEVTARDRTVEVRDGAVTRIDANDVLLAVNNPDELVETGRTIAHPSVNGGTAGAWLDFPTGSLPVIYDDVVLTIHFEDEVTAEDTARVEFIAVPAGTSGDLTWAGQASDFVHLDRREWLWGANWSAGQPPLNPTPGTVIFEDEDNTVVPPKLLAPVPDWDGLTPTNRWRIGAFRVGNTGGAHTLDLGGQTLEVAGNAQIERLFPTGAASMTITNGTLAVGGNVNTLIATTLIVRDGALTLSPSSTFDVAPGSTTVITNSATVASPFRDLLVGAVSGGSGVLDMRDGAFVGGALDVRDLRIGGQNSGSGAYGEFRLAPGTLDSLRVSRHFWLNSTGGSANNQRGWGRIGAPDPARGNLWYLPGPTDIWIGSSSSRGTLQCNWNSSSALSTGVSLLGMTSGGSFEAWLSALVVGKSNGTGGKGMVDLRQAGSFFMNATTVEIGAKDPSYDYASQGEVFLPSGEATFGTLTIGRSGSASSFGRLELNDTRVTVTGAATLHASAQITINVAATGASGLTLSALPTVESGATVTIVFEAPPTHTELHVGLKIAGDVVDDLEAAGWLTIDSTGLGGLEAVIYRSAGDTYVGIPPPAGTLFLLR